MEDYIQRREYEERIGRIDDENERQNHRLTELEKTVETVNRLVSSIEKLTVQIEQMQRQIERQSARLERIEQEPADKWRAVTKTIVTGVISALVAYFLAKGGII